MLRCSSADSTQVGQPASHVFEALLPGVFAFLLNGRTPDDVAPEEQELVAHGGDDVLTAAPGGGRQSHGTAVEQGAEILPAGGEPGDGVDQRGRG